jgi:hypothetical protein
MKIECDENDYPCFAICSKGHRFPIDPCLEENLVQDPNKKERVNVAKCPECGEIDNKSS